MATYDGQKLAVYINGTKSTGTKVLDVRKIDIPDGSSDIDLTSVDDVPGGYKRTRPGLKDGKFTFEVLHNGGNGTLNANIDSSTPHRVTVYASTDDSVAILDWSALFTASWSISYDGAITRTVTVRRQAAGS